MVVCDLQGFSLRREARDQTLESIEAGALNDKCVKKKCHSSCGVALDEERQVQNKQTLHVKNAYLSQLSHDS